jgi:hypothetical protein
MQSRQRVQHRRALHTEFLYAPVTKCRSTVSEEDRCVRTRYPMRASALVETGIPPGLLIAEPT